MDRRRPLRRRRALRGRSELRRGKALDSRSELKRRTELVRRVGLKVRRRERPKEGPLSPEEWRRQVNESSGWRCIVTGARVTDADAPHHPVPKQVLRRRGLYDRVWDPRNGVAVKRQVHGRHELAFRRIPGERLPERVFEFAAELGPWAVDLVHRLHPTTRGGPSGRAEEES